MDSIPNESESRVNAALISFKRIGSEMAYSKYTRILVIRIVWILVNWKCSKSTRFITHYSPIYYPNRNGFTQIIVILRKWSGNPAKSKDFSIVFDYHVGSMLELAKMTVYRYFECLKRGDPFWPVILCKLGWISRVWKVKVDREDHF